MSCELCTSEGGELLWRDARCRVVLVDEAGYPGYCRVIWQAHAAEMSELNSEERFYLMHVVFEVEAALREWLQPDKVNLASLGNVVPHLHWHVIPRFRDDPHFPNPVWSARMRQPAPRSIDLDALKRRLAAHLVDVAAGQVGGPKREVFP
jgi:diadenosine tetraphosphate (Ap4A) HIT family hydrolase